HQSQGRVDRHGTRASPSAQSRRCAQDMYGPSGPSCNWSAARATWRCSTRGIDSKLRGCDLIALRVDDVAPNGYAVDRANIRQRKTGLPVRVRRARDQPLTTRQYARLVSIWVSSIGLERLKYTTHSMRRTMTSLIYRRTGNLRAVQLLLGYTRIESTVRYLGVEVDDGLDLAERIEI